MTFQRQARHQQSDEGKPLTRATVKRAVEVFSQRHMSTASREAHAGAQPLTFGLGLGRRESKRSKPTDHRHRVRLFARPVTGRLRRPVIQMSARQRCSRTETSHERHREADRCGTLDNDRRGRADRVRLRGGNSRRRRTRDMTTRRLSWGGRSSSRRHPCHIASCPDGSDAWNRTGLARSGSCVASSTSHALFRDR